MSSDPSRPTNVRYGVLALLCSMAFLTYLDRICIMQVQGDIVTDLGLDQLSEEDEAKLRAEGKQNDPEARKKIADEQSKMWMGWIFSAFVWGYALFEVPGGWLGDVWGSRAVIFRIVLWWSLFTALTGSVDSIAYLFTSYPEPVLLVFLMVVVRFLFGLGEAGAYPNAGRALGRWFPLYQRAFALGAIWMASRMGGALSPVIVQELKWLLGGWRQAFWFLGAAGAVWAFCFYAWFRNRPEEKCSVNAAECKLIRSDAAATGSIYDDSHRGTPWLTLLLSPHLWMIYITAAAVSFSWYFYVTFLPRYLKDQFHVDYSESALLTGLPLAAGGITCLIGGGLSDWLVRKTGSRRWGRSILGMIGFGGASIGPLLIPYMETAQQVIAVICLGCAIQDLALPAFWAACVDIGQRYSGTLMGCMNSIGAVGGALSPLVAASLEWNTAFLVFAASYGLGGLLWLWIDATKSIMQPQKSKT